jgi:hypothetical protein
MRRNGRIRIQEVSDESHVAAISQNFFVFGATITVFSTGVFAEKENTVR